MSGGQGAPDRSMIGMARLSCQPCRRRKSKCDREEPCSSCILRNTERLCYSSEMEVDPSKGATTQAKRTERPGQVSPAASPPSSKGQPTKEVQGGRKPFKKAKWDSSESGAEGQSLLSDNKSLDRQAVLKTIQSMKTTMQHLQASIGVSETGMLATASTVSVEVRWDDVAHLLPSREDCELIIDCFFSDALWQTSVVNSIHFRKRWQGLIAGQTEHRTFIAMICLIAAHSLLLAPAYDLTSRLAIQTEHTHFYSLGQRLLHQPEAGPLGSGKEGLEEAQVQSLMVTYLSFAGYSDLAWTETGRGIRLCKALRFYDEDRGSTSDLSDWDLEIRRRVAWHLCETDRWLSFHYLRSPDLPSNVQMDRPSFYSDDCYDEQTGRLKTSTPTTLLAQSSFEMSKYPLAIGANRVNKFLHGFQAMTPDERYQQARHLDDYLAQAESTGLPAGITKEAAFDVRNLTSTARARQTCQSLIAYSTLQRLRCTVMRQFLLDMQAPKDLRMAALEFARKIIETTPPLVTLSSSPWVSFSSTWCSGHLFCAASTFAIVYLGETEQDVQDLSWFAGKIFEVIEALSFLSTKDRVAKRCEELLTALCTSKDWLRERFLASRSGRTHNQSQRQSDPSLEDGDQPRLPNLTSDSKSPHFYHSHMMGNTKSMFEPSQWTATQSSQKTLPPSSSQRDHPTRPSFVPLDLAASTQTFKGAASDPADSWLNWPLLDDHQWSSLLSTLEQDANAIAGSVQ